ncbi:MAG: hypothetical protein ACJAV5_001204 [Vicingaceae bacterium]|jgi:hypothetical protein
MAEFEQPSFDAQKLRPYIIIGGGKDGSPIILNGE